jgi:carbon storage regulator (csrA)
MLILTRKAGEALVLDGGIEIKITEVCGDQVKIGITAPADVKVYRKELYATIQENRSAAKGAPSNKVKDALLHLK